MCPAKWDRPNNSYTKPSGSTLVCDYLEDLLDGIDTAFTWQFLTTDPADASWGAAQRGAVWTDGGVVGTSIGGPLLARWEETSSGVYGWRYLCLRYMKWLDTPQSVTMPGSQPYTADETWTDVDFTSLLDGAGVQDHDDKLVDAVVMRVRVKDSGTIDTTDSSYVEWRKKGATHTMRFYTQVSGRWAETWIVVPLDSDEIAQFQAVVADNGSPSMTCECEVWGFMELI